MFADDTKMWATIRKKEDTDELDRLIEWSDRWLLRLNPEKCKIMHIGQDDLLTKYTIRNSMQSQELKETKEERDL
jgi:hypothetical protein